MKTIIIEDKDFNDREMIEMIGQENNSLLLDDINDDENAILDKKEYNTEDLLNTKISYKTKSMDIESVLNSLKRGDFMLPKYQRRYVWEKNQASNLILSLIKNIPIPPVYLYFNAKDNKYVILDGQQRITTLFMYYNSVFYKNKDRNRVRLDFDIIYSICEELDEIESDLGESVVGKNSEKESRITSLKEQLSTYNLERTKFYLNSKDDKENYEISFKAFEENAQRVLRRKDIETVFVQCDDKNPHKVYTEIFKLLNSAGKELSSQEIRNGVHNDNPLYEKVHEFNDYNDKWRKIYGNSLVSKDMEYLLRFLALEYYTTLGSNNKVAIKDIKCEFNFSNIIDLYSDLFNIKDKSDDEEIIRTTELVTNLAKDELCKLSNFFDNLVISDNNSLQKGKILILEAFFIAYTKLKLYEKNISLDYSFISKHNLPKDFKIGNSSSNKGNVEKRINKAISILQKYVQNLEA